MNKVKITSKKHPHYGEIGMVVREDEPLSLAFLGVMDRIKGEDGEEFFARKSEYKHI